jgi:hypothetical protein
MPSVLRSVGNGSESPFLGNLGIKIGSAYNEKKVCDDYGAGNSESLSIQMELVKVSSFFVLDFQLILLELLLKLIFLGKMKCRHVNSILLIPILGSLGGKLLLNVLGYQDFKQKVDFEVGVLSGFWLEFLLGWVCLRAG